MFKNLRTSTKLLLLCSVFVVSIVVVTYGLAAEKKIAIHLVRKELVGVRYLEGLSRVYDAILTEGRDRAPTRQTDNAVNESLATLAQAQSHAVGLLDTAKFEQGLAAAIRELLSSRMSGIQKQNLIVDALTKARNLASRIGDDSNLALDPDLDSYHLQHIVVTEIPTLLERIGDLQQSLLRASLIADEQSIVRPLILDGRIRSTLEGLQRSLAAAYRGNADDGLRQTIDTAMTSMVSATKSYLETVHASRGAARDPASLDHSYASTIDSVMNAWTTSQVELKQLLHERLSNLLDRLRSSLILNGLLVSLSLVLAVMTYRGIVGPLRQLEGLANQVGETGDYSLRSNYKSRDEIGRLTVAFNTMLAELGEARERDAADQARTAAMQAELARVSTLTMMGELAASIAHEINQPLTAVVTNANAGLRWLNGQAPNVEEVRSALKRIVNDGQRGSKVIGSIRAMLKKGSQERTQLDLNGLIREVMTLVQAECKRRGVSIQTELANDLPRVWGDRIQVGQVLLNLTLNAVEAMASVSDQPRVLWMRSERHEPDGILLTVEDSGPGIDLKNIDRIFETFFTTKPEGMGLGLSICRSIVEAHGGRISASQANPHGSVFKVFLPVGEPSNIS
jgi:signal transduction histidine kinase